MPLTLEQVIALIDTQVSILKSHKNQMSEARRLALLQLRKALQQGGFPQSAEQRQENSLIPLLFQEANYDDLDWTSPQGELGHLEGLFRIDVAVQNKGAERFEMTDDQYRLYVQKCLGNLRRSQK